MKHEVRHDEQELCATRSREAREARRRREEARLHERHHEEHASVLVAERRRRQQRQEAVLTKAVPTEEADARRALQKQREEEAEEDEETAALRAELARLKAHRDEAPEVTRARALAMPASDLAAAPRLSAPPAAAAARAEQENAGGRTWARHCGSDQGKNLAMNGPLRTVGARAANMGFIAGEKRLEQQFDAREQEQERAATMRRERNETARLPASPVSQRASASDRVGGLAHRAPILRPPGARPVSADYR